MSSERDKNARAAYDYMVQAHKDVLNQQEKTAERANKLALVTSLVIVGLAYGASNLVLVAQETSRNAYLYWAAVIVGTLAALFLVVSFIAAITRSHVTAIGVPESSGLVDHIDDPAFQELEHARVLGALVQNLQSAIDENSRRANERSCAARLLGWAPQLGFALTSVFVILTFTPRMVCPVRSVSSESQKALVEVKHVEGDAVSEKESDPKPERPKEKKDSKKDKEDKILKDIVKPPRTIRGSLDNDPKRYKTD